MKIGALYVIRFPSGKSYIGITSQSVRRRRIVHLHHARKGRNSPLHRAIRKYGDNSFTICPMVFSNDWKYLCDLERRAIVSFGTRTPNGYNVTAGGEGVLGVKKTAQQRQQMSEARKGQQLGNKHALGYRHTEETRLKISHAGIARIVGSDTRAKISASKIGNTYNVGRRVSPATRIKISESQIGREFSDEHRKKLSVARRAREGK